MNTSSFPRMTNFLAGVLLLLAATTAEAGLFRAYLSVNGSDANPCTLPAPCRLLPAALTAVNSGGEIWILDSGNFNTSQVTVDKSVSILAVPGALGSVVASGAHALLVSGTSIKVSLRNLQILHLAGGQSGIYFGTGARLVIDGCEIYGLPQNGIESHASADLVVKNTVVRNNGENGIRLNGYSSTTLDNVHIVNNALVGLLIQDGSSVEMTDSVVAENAQAGILAESTIGGIPGLVVERTVIRGGSTGLFVTANGGVGSHSNVVARRNSILGNGIGVQVTAGTGTFAIATLEGNVIAHNTTGVLLNGTGTRTAQTLGNNTFTFNGSDVSGSLTGFGTQ